MTKAALRLPDGSDAAVVRRNSAALKRHTFTTSRLLEFTSERELALQTGFEFVARDGPFELRRRVKTVDETVCAAIAE